VFPVNTSSKTIAPKDRKISQEPCERLGEQIEAKEKPDEQTERVKRNQAREELKRVSETGGCCCAFRNKRTNPVKKGPDGGVE
jgi:hypothetical protein